MLPLLHHSTSIHAPPHHHHHHHRPPSLFKLHPRRVCIHSIEKGSSFISSNTNQDPQQPQRTLFPGGYKRPEIKLPNVVLQLSPEEVLDDEKLVLDVVDEAVSGRVGIVVLSCGDGSGRNLYEAACLLKSVIKDRAYLLISERVDIAAAVNASGVVVSDQGLPAIVARNTMMDSKSESVFLPLVGRNVESSNAALIASAVEGADFLIYVNSRERSLLELTSSVVSGVKIPTFVEVELLDKEKVFSDVSYLLQSGASGLVVSLEGLKLVDNSVLNKSFRVQTSSKMIEDKLESSPVEMVNGISGEKRLEGFVKVEEKVLQFIESERSLLLEAINVIQRATPLMEEVSLLSDAVSCLSQPFLLVIVGEFNSGKSTFINALLGRKYLKDGVVPTTNEITFLRYSENSGEQQHCERHPDGQYICYLPSPILKDMIIVDTPGTNVILQRQQRLTEEFVPRADLLLFVMSADRPLTESEVTFLRYTQQWKKKVVFVLNKSDIYQNATELQEAIAFIKENTQKLLNTEVLLFPVSARSALKAKVSELPHVKKAHEEFKGDSSYWETTSFYELEKFLYSFLDGSTSTGIERMKLKLETPIAIAEQLLSASQRLVGQDCQQAKNDLRSIDDLISSVRGYVAKMENESLSWKRQSLSLIDKTQYRIIEILESTLRLSNLDIVTSYIFRGGKTAPIPAAATVKNDVITPALSEAQKLLGEYVAWLQSNNAQEARFYEETFEKRWASFLDPGNRVRLETCMMVEQKKDSSIEVMEDFSAAAASKLFDQEIREVFLGTFGGIGTASLSASLLTSVLPTTLEDLLALGLCSAGGYFAIANFPVRRQKVVEKVKRTADSLARKLEEAMQKDLLETTESLEKYVKLVGKPYQDLAQKRVDELLAIQDELTNVAKRLQTLQIDVQNLHIF